LELLQPTSVGLGLFSRFLGNDGLYTGFYTFDCNKKAEKLQQLLSSFHLKQICSLWFTPTIFKGTKEISNQLIIYFF